jgi:ribosomal protein L9
VDRRRVDLGGGIKTLGEHLVRIDLHPEVVAEVAVNVVAEA